MEFKPAYAHRKKKARARHLKSLQESDQSFLILGRELQTKLMPLHRPASPDAPA